MSNSLLKYILLMAVVSLTAVGCRKNTVEELGDRGTTMIKILESPTNAFFFEPFANTRQVALFSVRRDANSNASLNTPVTLTLRVDTAAIRTYNTANSNTFELLPDSLFTIGTGITKTGNLTYQVTLQPGEFAKDFTVNINGAKWDLSRKYAMPITIQDAGGVALSSGQEKVLAMISIKNKYDGRYTMTGTMVDAANSALTAKSPTDVHLATTGANSVVIVNAGTQISSFRNLFPIMNGADESAYGAFMPVFYFDANNKVTKVENFYGQPASNTRRAEIDPTGENSWDPATKTLKVKWFMFQPSVVASGPRTSFNYTFEFKGPR
jgi:hypothetical protein